MNKVAITGSTGVVGSALLRLLLDDGYEANALVRSGKAAETVARAGAQPVEGDLLDRQSLEELVDGCRWVFNVAGVNELCAQDSAGMERVNIGAVANVIEVCRKAGVERLIHTSSAVTLGESRGTVGDEESAHRGRFLSEYERTKFLGEQVLFEQAGALDVVAVNPSSVQGPGRATGTGKIILDVLNGRLPVLVDTSLSIVDIEDCARGHLLAASHGIAGERYVLSAPPLRVAEALEAAANATGKPVSVRLLAPGLVAGLGKVIVPLARMFKRDLPICSEMVRVMTFGHRYDGSRAERDLGLSYRPAEETITRLVDWFRSEGLLEG